MHTTAIVAITSASVVRVARRAERGQPAPNELEMRTEAAMESPKTSMKLQAWGEDWK